MRILLTTLNAKYIHVNLAIRLLYQMNKDKEGLAWKEFAIKESKDDIAEECSTYDIVAFSCYIWNITPTLEVARKIKRINPAVKILLGGPEVSYEWNDVISKDEVDFIITGEGEIPFKVFLEKYPELENVPNLIRKTENGVVYSQASVQFDLNDFREIRPYADDSPETLVNKVCYIETSRGCPYKCEFCLASLDNKVRYLPDAVIKDTLLYLMQNGRVIKFLDRTFNVKKNFTIDIFKFILENKKPGNIFQFEITADILHPDIVKFIHEQVPEGLFRFEIGIQTVNQKANLEVKRKQNFEKTKEIIISLRHKVEMHLDLIVGLPFDSREDIKFSFEEVFKLQPPELQLGFLKFLKGTPVRERYPQYGYVFDPAPPYQIIKSDFLSEEDLHKIQDLEETLELFWNKKRALNTLKYVSSRYSIFDFLLELGNYFSARKEFHKHTFEEAFEILHGFASEHFASDKILQQLIALDYYLHYKIRPKQLFSTEIPLAEQAQLIKERRLDNQKFRYIFLPLDFDLGSFFETGNIILNKNMQVIRYNGVDLPELVFSGDKNFEKAAELVSN